METRNFTRTTNGTTESSVEIMNEIMNENMKKLENAMIEEPSTVLQSDTITGLQSNSYDHPTLTSAYSLSTTIAPKSYPDCFGIVQKFMQACDQFPGKDQEDLYVKLITEEYNEFLEGIKNNDRVEILDAICDLIWVLNGYAVSANMDFNGAYHEVAASNMSKIDPTTGKAIKNEYGKVMKPASYFAPDLTKFV